MGLSRRQFTREFTLAAIQRLEQGVSIAEVARALEVSPSVLHRWRKEFRQGQAMRFQGAGSGAGCGTILLLTLMASFLSKFGQEEPCPNRDRPSPRDTF